VAGDGKETHRHSSLVHLSLISCASGGLLANGNPRFLEDAASDQVCRKAFEKKDRFRGLTWILQGYRGGGLNEETGFRFTDTTHHEGKKRET